MQTFINFLVNNYLWFLVVTLVLVFALIGYLVDTNEKKEDNFKENRNDLEKLSDVESNKASSQMEVLEDYDK